ncbi:glycosyl hydrolase 2 galactose-binding domain-containing protein, partial [Enterococcus faecalis]|uniref:glycosyl hydrolase 2 galactose-binding domain-containing protein n=1 Tax=Enterococcus faecalis TaxID=1351 RepID=UPI00403F2D79
MTPPVARPEPSQAPLVAVAPDRWTLQGWRLAAAPDIAADGSMLSQPGDVAGLWRAATVPGTVLATLVDRGVYPDPYVALNNMAIPESLARQDYWYRTQFTVPPEAAGKRLSLVLNGVNYAAQVFVNGQDL